MPRFRRSRALMVGSALALMVALFSLDYTVKPGDTLGRIARDHGVSLSDLVAANNIANPNLIHIGQVLTIPGENGEPDAMYTVQRGDTLSKIASSFGSSVATLAQANSISNPNLIRIGQELLIPAGGSGGSGSAGSAPSRSKTKRSGDYHIVKSGESLEQIAAQYAGVSVDDLVRANGIVNGVIYRGTRLFLDGPGFVGEGSAGEISYTIERGDRLGDIAHDHGVSVNALISLNNISNPNLIRIGQEILIPTGSAWVCPVENASFFNSWGFARGGGTRFHEGSDLFAPRGTPVRAPVAGTVKFKTGTIGGNQFTLDAGDGVRWFGSHMDSFGKDGQVRAGDIVGYVGNTGNAAGTSPHLHFGVDYKGLPMNPYPTLVKHGCK